MAATIGVREPVYSSEKDFGLAARLREVYRHRNLIWELTARNLKVRYRRSVFGFLWAVLNPLLNALVYAFVFQVLLRSPIDRFLLFITIALVAWNTFGTSVIESMYIITGSSHLVSRVRFPHEVLPISVVLTNTINFFFAMPSIFLAMILTRTPLHVGVIYFPVTVVSAFCFSLGIAFVAAAVNVFFQDTRNFLDVVMGLWFFLTPTIYRIQDVFPSAARIVYIANPMASIIESYRQMFYYNGGWPAPDFMARTLVSCIITLVVGWLVFASLSARFVEEL
jgi:lipopolysaccharide transport system permease protein